MALGSKLYKSVYCQGKGFVEARSARKAINL